MGFESSGIPLRLIDGYKCKNVVQIHDLNHSREALLISEQQGTITMQEHTEATLLLGFVFGIISNLTYEAQKTNNSLKEHLEALHKTLQKRISEIYYKTKDLS